MGDAKIAPYGAWASPITADTIVSESVSLGQPELFGEDVYWIETRPNEKGRYVIMRRRPGHKAAEVNPAPFNARTRVHEYGGGAMVLAPGGVYFSNFADQRLYRCIEGEAPRPITPEGPWRYADGELDERRERIVCVREDHAGGSREALNEIVSLDAQGGGAPRVLATGHDFYSSPRLNPDRTRLAYLAWNHPGMPWDGTELWVAELDAAGGIAERKQVTGSEGDSIYQPEWSPGGVLHFVSDRSGWWNLYRLDGEQIRALTHLEAEFGRPAWIFGARTYGFDSERRIVCAYTRSGRWSLAFVDTESGELTELDQPYTTISDLRVGPGRVVFIGGSSAEPESILDFDLQTRRIKVLRRSSFVAIDPGYLSEAEPIEFPTEDGLTAHAYFYAPKNADYAGPPREKPPLIVMSHGGPTSAASSSLNARVQFWTSRGFAVVDVNYGGSTGYGRAYRERLKGRWGIVDVADCVNAARFLTRRGDADSGRLAIRGGSAGGYTTLSALTFTDFFHAGASYYGVSDLEALALETHKFESRYLDGLIGPYPERRDLYLERSPIHHSSRLSCPVILFQGLEDAVVPPNQAETLLAALKDKGLPVAYVPYEGEQHGFRQAKNIKHSLRSELYFYSKIFGFEPADRLEPVRIWNLP